MSEFATWKRQTPKDYIFPVYICFKGNYTLKVMSSYPYVYGKFWIAALYKRAKNGYENIFLKSYETRNEAIEACENSFRIAMAQQDKEQETMESSFATGEFPWKFKGDGSPPDYQTFCRKDNYFLAVESKSYYWDVSLRTVSVNGSHIWIFSGTASTKERAIRMCENVYLAYMNQQDKEKTMEDNPNDNISLMNGKIRLVGKGETKDLVEKFLENGVSLVKSRTVSNNNSFDVLYIEPKDDGKIDLDYTLPPGTPDVKSALEYIHGQPSLEPKDNGNIDPDDELAPRIHDLESGIEGIDDRLRSLEAEEESKSPPLLERAIEAIENILDCPNMENMNEAKEVWEEYSGIQYTPENG